LPLWDVPSRALDTAAGRAPETPDETVGTPSDPELPDSPEEPEEPPRPVIAAGDTNALAIPADPDDPGSAEFAVRCSVWRDADNNPATGDASGAEQCAEVRFVNTPDLISAMTTGNPSCGQNSGVAAVGEFAVVAGAALDASATAQLFCLIATGDPSFTSVVTVPGSAAPLNGNPGYGFVKGNSADGSCVGGTDRHSDFPFTYGSISDDFRLGYIGVAFSRVGITCSAWTQ